MTDWTSGYVTDVAYAYRYQPEPGAGYATLALLDKGIAPPPAGPCCDLGFGQGVSLNVHAAATNTAWWGTDFMPGQAAFAQGLGKASGAQTHLFDQSFEEFCARTDLPDFACITLHGIWSWISADNRALVVDFIRRKLMVGGLLYMGYNAQPGWANFMPMRNLMAQFGASMVPAGLGTGPRLAHALDFADRLVALKPAYAQLNPQVAERLRGMRTMEAAYLAHEFCSLDWHPMSFDELAGCLGPAKVEFAASATFTEHVPAMNLTAEQHTFVESLPDLRLRETTRDFFYTQQFRRDYWVKGPTRLDPMERMVHLRAQRVVLTQHPATVDNNFTGILGELELDTTLLGPLLLHLGDYRPRTLAELEAFMAPKGMTFNDLLQTVMLLVGRGDMAMAQGVEAAAAARPHTDALNTAILALAPGGQRTLPCLASPVTGNGRRVSRVQQLCLLASRQGLGTAEEIARWVEGVMGPTTEGGAAQGGQSGQWRQEAETFLGQTLPALRGLGVV